MKTKNHLAYKILSDSDLVSDIVIETAMMATGEVPDINGPRVKSLVSLLSPIGSKNYIISNSVIEDLSMIKVSKSGVHHDWSPLINIPKGKYTIALPNGSVYRIVSGMDGNASDLVWISRLSIDKNKRLLWVLFWVKKGVVSENFDSDDVVSCEDEIFRILLFMFISEAKTLVIKPGEKHVSKDGGKLKVLNNTDIDFILVNRSWNVTSVRTDSFSVSGHFAIRWTGKGRTDAKLVFIDPFVKNGYIRKATKNISDGAEKIQPDQR